MAHYFKSRELPRAAPFARIITSPKSDNSETQSPGQSPPTLAPIVDREFLGSALPPLITPSLKEDGSESRSLVTPLNLAMAGIPNRELLGAPASPDDSSELRPLPRRPVQTIVPIASANSRQRSDDSADARD
jgi:hypothetical protein